jgi:hypothetical protein
MSDFLRYMEAQAKNRAAFEAYKAASARLELAQIKERLAELRSQHDPLAQLMRSSLPERERLCAAAEYLVTGRLPLGAFEPMKKENRSDANQDP